jgi:hypothetical protein
MSSTPLRWFAPCVAALLVVSSCQSALDLDRYGFEERQVVQPGVGGSGGVDGMAGAGTGGLRSAEPGESAAVGSATAPETGGSGASVERDLDAGSTPPLVPCEGSSVEACDGLDNDCDDLVDPTPVCPETCTGFQLDGHGYMFCSELADRSVASDRCRARDMTLVWIDTERENESLVSEVAAIASVQEGGGLVVQIGASDARAEGSWVWVGDETGTGDVLFWQGNGLEDLDAAPVGNAYTNWFNGEPNQFMGVEEDCGLLLVEDQNAGRWNDYECSIPYPFVCEQL